MSEPLYIHPVDAQDVDAASMPWTVSVRILHAATGQPVVGAVASEPEVDDTLQAVLDRRGCHPLRVLKQRHPQFTNKDLEDFSFPVRNLRLWRDVGGGPPMLRQLEETWNCSGEVVFPAADGERVATADGERIFQKVTTAAGDRFVCVRAGNEDLARPSLATDRDGVLAIPVPIHEWLNGPTITIALRDYLLLPAVDSFEPETLAATSGVADPGPTGHRALRVRLDGTPPTVTWTASAGGIEESFTEQAEAAFPPAMFAPAPLTFWAVRRVAACTDLVNADVVAAPSGACSRRGVLIHFNSGLYISEKQGAGTRKCAEAFTAGENDYMMRPEMALWILRRSNQAYEASVLASKNKVVTGRLGYAYHIARDGGIYVAGDEARSFWHAGNSREPNSVTALENGVPNARRSLPAAFASPLTSLNNKYVGIDLLGNHGAGYHFTAEQHWYLDRLIENIRDRCPAVTWNTILGHDEVRAAYNASATTQDDAKPDPGAAIDGMDLLRGRHGAPFPAPPAVPAPPPAGAAATF